MAVRRIKRLAWPRQQSQSGECFQIEPAGYGKSGLRLIGAQRKFQCRSVDSVDLFAIKSVAREGDLCRHDHIALHGGRGSLKWRAGKNSSR